MSKGHCLKFQTPFFQAVQNVSKSASFSLNFQFAAESDVPISAATPQVQRKTLQTSSYACICRFWRSFAILAHYHQCKNASLQPWIHSHTNPPDFSCNAVVVLPRPGNDSNGGDVSPGSPPSKIAPPSKRTKANVLIAGGRDRGQNYNILCDQ